MSVIFKISLGSDIRRISVSASTSFAEFTELVRKLFIDAIAENFVVKYTDDEGDLVSITCDRELAEAFAFANGKPLLRLSIVEVKPKVPAPAPTPTPAPSAVPEREIPKPSAAAPLPTDPIFGIIEQALETPELQGLIGAFGISTEGIKNIISGLKTEVFDDEKGKEKEQESEKEKESESVHEAYCDHCDKHIVGIRYKCSVCCDFDLCSTCEAMLPSASVHDPQHLFLKVFTPVALPSRRPMLRNFYLEPAGQGCHWRRWGPGGHCGGPGGPRGQWGGPWSGRRCHWRQNQCNNNNAESASTSDTPVTETCPRWQRPGQNWLSSRFICDVTINDGTQMEPNNAFHKVWRLKNTGNNDWPAGTALTFIAGDSLTRGQDAAVIAEAVKPGEEINVGIDMVAPEKAGRYISNFRLVTPDGISFGHRVWADIMVVLPSDVEEKKKEEEVPVAVPQPVVEEKKEEEVPVPAPQPVVVVEEKKPEEPAPAPAPAPVAPLLPILEVGYPYAQQLAALVSMGFADVDANKKALNKRKGNVVAAVNDLLG